VRRRLPTIRTETLPAAGSSYVIGKAVVTEDEDWDF
jgi:hypothetical protein